MTESIWDDVDEVSDEGEAKRADPRLDDLEDQVATLARRVQVATAKIDKVLGELAKLQNQLTTTPRGIKL